MSWTEPGRDSGEIDPRCRFPVSYARFCHNTVYRDPQVGAPGVENLDLSSIIGTNHFHYNRRMPEVLAALALDDCSRYISRGDDDAVDASAAGPGGGKDPADAFESVENFY